MKLIKYFTCTVLTASLGLVGTVATAGGHGIMVGGAEMVASKDIIENASELADHTTLVTAITAAGLVETRQGEAPFTVLAPTNVAFDALPQGTVATLLEAESIEMLQDVLSCHVVAAKAMASDVN